MDPVSGFISDITVTNPGIGYTAAPNVVISTGVTGVTPATATAQISLGVVSSIALPTAPGGFTTPEIIIAPPALTTDATATAVASGFVQNTVSVTSGGEYTVNAGVVNFSMPDLPLGVRAAGSATMEEILPATVPPLYRVIAVAVTTPGSGYTTAPTIDILDGSLVLPAPTPAVAVATISINHIDVTSGGSGYVAGTPPVTTLYEISNPNIAPVFKETLTATVSNGVSGITIGNHGLGYLTPGIKKFVDTLPGLRSTSTGQTSGNYIPVAVPDTTTYPGTDYYEIGLVQYRHVFSTQIPATLLRGYVQIETPALIAQAGTVTAHAPLTNANLDPIAAGITTATLPDNSTFPATPILINNAPAFGIDMPRYLGPTIVASKDRPVRVKFRNLLPNGAAGDLFLPTDTTLMGSGMGPDAVTLNASGIPIDTTADTGSVLDAVRNPECGTPDKMVDPVTTKTICYAENRATLHLHGGVTPWISDGTPHQWITPAGENTAYPQGVSVSNVPDMEQPVPGDGSQTFFYTNQQSARLMFYHDHAWGITRLNVYAGEAAGYVVTDDMEASLINPSTGVLRGLDPALSVGTPLIIQDKTFVSAAVAAGETFDTTVTPAKALNTTTDPTWNAAKWGGEGSLWTPHVYMPAQNPGDPTGMSAFGRWMYGPWFWPPAKNVKYPPIDNPYYDPACNPNFILPDGSNQFCEPALIPSTPNISVGMEAFNDTPIVNGTAYPTTTVDPKAYRYRVLNAANDRFWNLSWYKADTRPTQDATTGLMTVPSTLSEVALNPLELEAAQTDPVVFPTPDTLNSPPGPSWIQIGTEGGFLPAPVIVPPHPTTWITDPTRFDVGNVDQHSLLLAPAERADVIVDFSKYAGQTLILYNDAPAAFPARVPGYDYYTGGPDLSPSGAPTTLPGYGPNTRTIMQVKVRAITPATAFDVPGTSADRMGALVNAFKHHNDANGKPAGVFEKGSDPIIVGQAAYNSAYGSNFVANGWCNSPTAPSASCDGFARVQEQGSVPGQPDAFKFKFDTLGASPATARGPQLSIPFEPKGMHDEMNSASFDEWGRMTANMGLEAPGATPLLQNIILYPFVNPATEIEDSSGMPSSLKVTPISSALDGTQLWKITHNGVDTHPIHFHLYDVQVLNRVTWDNIIIPPEPTELGWKETVRVSPLEDTIVALRPIVPTLPFAVPDSKRLLNPALPEHAKGDVNSPLGTQAGFNNTDVAGNPMPVAISNEVTNFEWEYVWHCHILSHEEMDMMRPVTVHVVRRLAPIPVITATRAGSQVNLTWTDGTPVNWNPITPVTANALALTWTNPGTAEIGYRIERAPVVNNVVGTYVVIGKPLANATAYSDLTADPNLGYRYRVVAYNAAGDSTSTPFTIAGALRASTTVVTSNRTPWATSGQSVTFTATVTPTAGAGIPGGTVQFVIDGTNAGTPQTLNIQGKATYTAATLALGSHTVTANYLGGDGVFNLSSSAAITQLVKASTSTTVATSLTPSRVGNSVTFTATVTPIGVLPAAVQFTIDGVNFGAPVTLNSSGKATLITNTLTVGNHTITAVYPGSASYITSTGLRSQRVNP